MKGEIELYNISFLILKVELHFKVVFLGLHYILYTALIVRAKIVRIS